MLYTGAVAGRTTKTEAVVLRLPAGRGRPGPPPLHPGAGSRRRGREGIRRTKSRSARVSSRPPTSSDAAPGLGRPQDGDGCASDAPARRDARRPLPALGRTRRRRGDAASFPEQEANARPSRRSRGSSTPATRSSRGPRPAQDPLALSFQLKLLWLSGYQPHTQSCAECGAGPPLAGYLPRAGGAVCRACAEPGTVAVSPHAFAAVDALLHRPLAEAQAVTVGERDAREILGLITAAYEFHGGFRLRTLSA